MKELQNGTILFELTESDGLKWTYKLVCAHVANIKVMGLERRNPRLICLEVTHCWKLVTNKRKPTHAFARLKLEK